MSKYTCNEIKDGWISSVPLILGFIPVAMTFGILAKNADFSIWTCLGFSMFVYAGASQFIALNLLLLDAGFSEIILTTLLVNFRHFLMSASLAPQLPNQTKKWSPLIAFGITDEIFSVASFRKKQLSAAYMITLEGVGYLAWVFGTFLGFVLGSVLPAVLQDSMGIALYAMFVAILIPEVKRSSKAFVLAILSGLINIVCTYAFHLPQGWSIILSVLIASLFGTYWSTKGGVVKYES
ncbi:MAG: AzlC family ABC transporter permease [Tissierellales bacterium]|nr:AzlC family ABC transporter permease [Tissierellales bacterium]